MMKTILFQIIILFSFVGVSYSSDVFYDPFKEWRAIEFWLRHGNQFGLSYFIVMTILIEFHRKRYNLKRFKAVLNIFQGILAITFFLLAIYIEMKLRLGTDRDFETFVKYFIKFSKDILIWFIPIQALVVFLFWKYSEKKE